MTDLQDKAFQLLLANKKEGYSRHLKKDFFYFAPDSIHFHQWFWDSCFHAIVMTNFKVEYAIREIDTLLSCQTENGFIPHIIFWKWRLMDLYQYFKSWRKEIHPEFRFFTAEIQAPVIGITLRQIYEKTKSIKFLESYLPRVQKYFDYLRQQRDPDNDSLISIITPMESGMDMAPQFDLPLDNSEYNPAITKGKISAMLGEYKKVKWNLEKIFEMDIFNFEDVAVNTIYALSLEDLAFLWEFVDKEKALACQELSTRVKNTLVRKCWDEQNKLFYGLYQRQNKEVSAKVKTISSLFPICLSLPDDYIESLLEHICDRNEFWLDYPLASVARDDPAFGPLTNTRYLWRGTTWINTNWFIAKGLLRHGKKDVYDSLKGKTHELVEKHGFCEYYDPFTGEPGKAMRNFGWTTLAVDI